MINWDAVELPPSDAQIQREAMLNDSLEYLKTTDWYITRLVETQEAVPEAVTQKRAQTRLLIKELKNAAQ